MAWAETPFLHSRSAIVYDIGRRVVLLEKNAALREIEVLAMLADGRGNEEIAQQLDIPDNMVKCPFPPSSANSARSIASKR
ncbi:MULTISPECIES: LuxR C-terminal-related transcriptional regulator [Paraburkholderia]|uniref:LuxR C-terminal-related transcriptional regulator n=1 Tax=Paraburkholderia TaxID=1822464 RepID=UPI001D132721|nr:MULTISPECIES: LuxR C-terminal-related transcriptional regulator [Paraburkholderia]